VSAWPVTKTDSYLIFAPLERDELFLLTNSASHQSQ